MLPMSNNSTMEGPLCVYVRKTSKQTDEGLKEEAGFVTAPTYATYYQPFNMVSGESDLYVNLKELVEETFHTHGSFPARSDVPGDAPQMVRYIGKDGLDTLVERTSLDLVQREELKRLIMDYDLRRYS